TDRLCSKRSATVDVSWRVADHHQTLARDVDAECFAGATSRNRRELRAMLVIGSKRVHLESIGVDSGSGKLDARAWLYIPRKQAKDHILARLERIENLGHSLERANIELPTLCAL